MQNRQLNHASTFINLLLALVILLGILSGAYYALRYGGLTIEVDGSRQAVSAEGIQVTGELINARRYSNGFGYAAVLAFVGFITGMEIQPLQMGSGIMIAVLLLVAFAAYKQFLGSALSGLIATFLLLLNPDFMFYITRGSHERLSWMYALLMLFLLLRSQQATSSVKQLFVYIVFFYMAFWAMVSGNVYFASTYLLAISIGLAIGWMFESLIFRKKGYSYLPSQWMRRLLLISLTSFILVFIFMFYTYLPARTYFNIFTSLFDRLGILFLGAEPIESPSAYVYFGSIWRSQFVYATMTVVQWAIAVGGFIMWVWSTFHLSQLNHQKRLLWQMYTSFGMLLAFGVVSDFAGFLNTNLQLRLFTPFVMFSCAMVVMGAQQVWPRLSPSFKQRMVPVAGLLVIIAFVGTQAKITNDPLVSNLWVFYNPAEVRASEWIDQNVENQWVWVDTWDHLQQVFFFHEGYKESFKNIIFYRGQMMARYNVLLSDRVILESNRKGFVLPSVVNDQKIYDNGLVKIYHPRSMTPYQR